MNEEITIVIKPPNPLQDGFSVFLAGSIEMGTAEDWQSQVEKGLSGRDIIVFNPRRDDWDSSWTQSIDNPQFYEQVKWELDALEKADIIALYLDPNTKSPISLLELGIHCQSGKMVICCPNGFYRKGNVDIVCMYYEIEQVSSIEQLINHINDTIDTKMEFNKG